MRRTGSGARWIAVLRTLTWVAGIAAAGMDCASARAAGEVPAEGKAAADLRFYDIGSGRFEVVAEAGEAGERVAELAQAAWRVWMGSLELPERLTTGITVRVVPGGAGVEGQPQWRVARETGGLVSLWLRGGGAAGLEHERVWLTGLAEAALVRKTMLLGVWPEDGAAPAWLCAGAAEAVLVDETPAMMDGWQIDMRRGGGAASGLREVLLGRPGPGRQLPEIQRLAAYGVWQWLGAEGGRGGGWRRLVAAVLKGEAAGLVLAREFGALLPERKDAREWELLWQVAAARLARAQLLPVLESEDSRQRLERLARIVALDTESGRDVALAAGDGWETRAEPWLQAEREVRTRQLTADFGRMHPIYRNAAGSLGRAWLELEAGREAEWRLANEEWKADFETGRKVEQMCVELLEKYEGGAAGGGGL